MIEFRKNEAMISQTDIEAVEILINGIFPQDYKQHMLKYNGGETPVDKLYFFSYIDEDGKEQKDDLVDFLPIGSEEGVEGYYEHKHEFLYPELITIGSTMANGGLAIKIKGENYGAIFLYYSDMYPRKIADSFTDFIESLDVQDNYL